jgi:hypothetical protein
MGADHAVAAKQRFEKMAATCKEKLLIFLLVYSIAIVRHDCIPSDSKTVPAILSF